MRKKIEIYTKDDHVIFGTLDYNDNKRLLIFVHGFTGSQDEHHYFNAVPFFIKNNFDTFRFDFYSREISRARSLSESSVTTHSQDLKSVIDNFKDKYSELVLIGHSFGSLVILSTDITDISKLVFWDPTTPFKDIKEKRATYDSSLDKYIFHWRMDFLISKQLVDEWMSLDLKFLTKKITAPCKFIFAGNANKYEMWKPYLSEIKVKNEHVILDGASHGFVEE